LPQLQVSRDVVRLVGFLLATGLVLGVRAATVKAVGQGAKTRLQLYTDKTIAGEGGIQPPESGTREAI